MSELIERFMLWRFNRQIVFRFWHAKHRMRHCPRRSCPLCAWRYSTGQFRTARIAMRERFKAQRATSSWWPTKRVEWPSGRSYRVAICPWEYEDYQRWKADRARGDLAAATGVTQEPRNGPLTGPEVTGG